MADTHKITKAEVVPIGPGECGIKFEFDDGYTDLVEVGDKETADWYASVQLDEEIVKGVNPLLINEAKAKTLRRPKA
jgi:hypothetical protein